MPTFREVRTRSPIPGFQCHHLIPTEVCDMVVFLRFFAEMRMAGFDPNCFESNGMHLPGSEKLAVIFGLPLHRGPHPHYNAMVAERIAVIVRKPFADQPVQLAGLLSGLRIGLRNGDIITASAKRDPLHAPQDMRRLDSDADFLFRLTQPC